MGDRDTAEDVRGLLRAFADLAATGARPRLEVGSDRFPPVWVGDQVPLARVADAGAADVVTLRSSAPLERLAAHDALHRHQQLLRIGWGIVVGTTGTGDDTVTVRLPLLTRPVELRRHLRGLSLQLLGDPELTARIDARGDQAALEAALVDLQPARSDETNLSRESAADLAAAATDDPALGPDPVARWLARAAAAADLAVAEVRATGDVPSRGGLASVAGADGLVVVAGAVLYAVSDTTPVDVASTLRAWAERPGLDDTAFAAAYGLLPDTTAVDAGWGGDRAPGEPRAAGDDRASGDDRDDGEDDVGSLLPLTAAQERVVRSARHARITVVSGAPGTGKSHTLAAVATDAVRRGLSVLVATRSPHAAEVLVDLLARHPGPAPVVFGGGRRRDALSAALTQAEEPGRRSLRQLEDAADLAGRHLAVARDRVAVTLEAESTADAWSELEPLVPMLAVDAPRVLDRRDDAASFAAAIEDVRARVRAAPDALRTRWARRRLYRRAGAAPAVSLDRLDLAVRAAAAGRARAQLQTGRDSTAVAALAALEAAEERWRTAQGALVDAQARDRDAAGRRTVAALAAGLRAGRATRRRHLAELDPLALAAAVPLWIGTLRDVDDLLPHTPAMFDLVVLDEASQIDQPAATTALLRGHAAVVAGDPAQLRHVSFVADDDVAAALTRAGVGHLVDRVDVRRASAFDLAAGASPAVWLDEHFRSLPHLIEFSARRFYDRRLHLVTRHPATEHEDAIDVVHVDGRRDEDGVNRAEVDAVVALVTELRDAGNHSVGVVTGLRAQADALEEGLLDALSLDAVESLGLRVGTVHAMQGDERDVVVASWAVSADDGPRSRRFVEDPNLFNVLVTRARRRLTVVTSLSSDVGGLLGDFLRHAEDGPSTPAPGGGVSRWTSAVAAELQRATGRTVRTGYPVGRWHVDLVVGDGPNAVAVACEVHPDGPDSHVARHRTLVAARWRTTDCFPTRFDDDPIAAALALAAELAATPDR